MKFTKIYALATAAFLTILPANAQQLPNAGFEDGWGECTPWTSNKNTTTKGTTPGSWCISQVIGIPGIGGATTVGEQVAGYNSEKAVKIYNSPNSIASSQIVPGYVTLGKTWSTAQGFSASNKDGGTFEGAEFAYKPDAISFQYMRSHGSTESQEQATVVVYLWKGEYQQEKVPGNISLGSPTKVTMINRDRNILGMSTEQGGDVTKKGELIASLNYGIHGDAADWTYFEQPIEYVSDATPEKINVILAANDYFGGASAVGKDNSLTVDDVKMIYYSRLSSIKVNGTELPDFADNKYEYTLDTPYSTDHEISFVTLGKSATASPVSFDDATRTATIKVTNVDADNDGLKEHNYVLTFAEPEAEEPKEAEEGCAIFTGTITINMGEDITLPNQTVVIENTEKGVCIFKLENFKLDPSSDESLGDIIVNINNVTVDKKTGVISYKGKADDISLAGGVIQASATLEGTEDENKNLVMNIQVLWHSDNGDGTVTDVPIEVKFNGTPADDKRFPEWFTGIEDILTDSNEAVRYILMNGVEVKEAPTSGLYIELRAGKATKVAK